MAGEYDDGDDIAGDADEPSATAAIQRAQPEFEFDDIAPAKPASGAPAAAPLTAAAAAAIETLPAAPPAPAVTAAPVHKTPADVAAEVISDGQPDPFAGSSESVVTPAGEVVPAVVVTDEAVEPVVVPAPEPVEPEPVTNVVVDRFAATPEDAASITDTLPGDSDDASAEVSTEVEPALTAPVSIEEDAAAAASQVPEEELPRTAGLFDDMPQPIAPTPADTAAKAVEQDSGERGA